MEHKDYQTNAVFDEWSKTVEATCRFVVKLTPENVRWHYDIFSRLPAHDSVLRPILARAKNCFVYGIKPDSRVYHASAPILQPDKRRHRILLSGDPISGHELLWNAHGGERGSIVIIIDRQALCAEEVFSHCYFPHVCNNTGAGHTPSAIRLARQTILQPDALALLLPRNNGMEWMDVFASSRLAVELFQIAWRVQIGKISHELSA
jgi:hypothetical protein